MQLLSHISIDNTCGHAIYETDQCIKCSKNMLSNPAWTGIGIQQPVWYMDHWHLATAYRNKLTDHCDYNSCSICHRSSVRRLESGNLARSPSRPQWAAPHLGRHVLFRTIGAATMLVVSRGSAGIMGSRWGMCAPSKSLTLPCGMSSSSLGNLVPVSTSIHLCFGICC